MRQPRGPDTSLVLKRVLSFSHLVTGISTPWWMGRRPTSVRRYDGSVNTRCRAPTVVSLGSLSAVCSEDARERTVDSSSSTSAATAVTNCVRVPALASLSKVQTPSRLYTVARAYRRGKSLKSAVSATGLSRTVRSSSRTDRTSPGNEAEPARGASRSVEAVPRWLLASPSSTASAAAFSSAIILLTARRAMMVTATTAPSVAASPTPYNSTSLATSVLPPEVADETADRVAHPMYTKRKVPGAMPTAE
mmetsp:Transcript_1963/g.6207  ORF Transcript_1963/g.6207 Transcript_1963/m.6207 type:complete len:249 (+) Transcript_1963:380-1126(+)